MVESLSVPDGTGGVVLLVAYRIDAAYFLVFVNPCYYNIVKFSVFHFILLSLSARSLFRHYCNKLNIYSGNAPCSDTPADMPGGRLPGAG